MSDYQAPLKEMQFLVQNAVEKTGLNNNEALADFDADTVAAILEAASELAGKSLSPMNAIGDNEGCRFEDGKVFTPTGWKQAFDQFAQDGWMGLALPMDFGGQELPKFIAQPVNEMWHSANLLQTRRDKGIDDVAIVRVEQLYPWPKETIKEELSKYPNADMVWCQEEPANMGYWGFVFPRLMYICQELKMKGGMPGYSGRRASASPATGLNKVHVAEQNFLVEEALTGKLESLPTPFARETKMAASKL